MKSLNIVISANGVNGHTASAQIHASCNQDYSVVIWTFDKKGTVPLGNGLNSTLKINGVDLGNGYSEMLGAMEKTLTLTSTLSGYKAGVGTFQGSTVVIVDFP
ncbi:PapG chaperone-binding domain-containing protein [Serratia ureilytica]|uniref:MrpH family fimbial adhesin n=1 Tax=Serratia ureilytica TaxID=300181 RepID=UPI00313AA3BB